jgi:hypothetical protein
MRQPKELTECPEGWARRRVACRDMSTLAGLMTDDQSHGD